MSFLSSFLNPTKNTEKAYARASAENNRLRQLTDPYYTQALNQGSQSNQMIADYLGVNGQSAQQSALAQFLNSPAFQFNFDQGQRAIDQSAAARGMSQSGANLKSLQEFGQGLQANEFNNRIAQLGGLGQMGFQGAGGLTQNSANSGNLMISQGQAKDAGNSAGLANVLSLLGTGSSFLTGGGYGNGRLF